MDNSESGWQMTINKYFLFQQLFGRDKVIIFVSKFITYNHDNANKNMFSITYFAGDYDGIL